MCATRSSGKSAKAKGGRGETYVSEYLKSHGWLIADKETSGLAGDDIFAQHPDGTWYSIEVKHVRSLKPDNRTQAVNQAQERAKKLAEALKHDCVAKRLGITFDPKNWLLVWKPSGYNNGTSLIVMRHGGAKTKYEVWE